MSSKKDSPLRAGVAATWFWAARSYEWQHYQPVDWYSTPPEAPFLVLQNSDELKLYRPLQDNALFAKFADLEPDERDFAEWANKYGSFFSLGEYIGELPLRVIAKPISHYADYNGNLQPRLKAAELFKTWYEEHGDLRRATKVWESWHHAREYLKNHSDQESEDIADLKKLIVYCSESNTVFHADEGGAGKSFSFSPDYAPKELDQAFPEVPILTHASVWLRKKIVQKMHPKNSFRVEMRVGQSPRFEGAIYPVSLLSAMWYLLLRAVKNTDRGKIRLRRCVKCNKWESLRYKKGGWTEHTSKCPEGLVSPHYIKEKLTTEEERDLYWSIY